MTWYMLHFSGAETKKRTRRVRWFLCGNGGDGLTWHSSNKEARTGRALWLETKKAAIRQL